MFKIFKLEVYIIFFIEGYYILSTHYLVYIVVEVWAASTQVSPQQCGMCREDGGAVHLPGPQVNQPCPSQPLVKVGHYNRLISQILPKLNWKKSFDKDIVIRKIL